MYYMIFYIYFFIYSYSFLLDNIPDTTPNVDTVTVKCGLNNEAIGVCLVCLSSTVQ